MSEIVYNDEQAGVELRNDATRTDVLQDERADAVNSGIVKDVSDRRVATLVRGKKTARSKDPQGAQGARRKTSASYNSHRDLQNDGEDATENLVTDVTAENDGSDLSEAPGTTSVRESFSKVKSRRFMGRVVDGLVYEELEESDELDDAAPVYHDLRGFQRAATNRKPARALTDPDRGSADHVMSPDSKNTSHAVTTSGQAKRTETLNKSERKGFSGRRYPKRHFDTPTSTRKTRDWRARFKPQGAKREAQRQVAAAVRTSATASAKTTAATMTATAGAASFPVVGVIGVLLLFLLSIVALSAVFSAVFGFWDSEDQKRTLIGLPPYITYEMVEEALACQDEYGHPAGATIAQIICESGQGETMSELATRDHNLFGMKWSTDFANEPEVSGSASWLTGEEFDGAHVTITDRFTVFVGDRECIRFRSRVFLQQPLYKDNALIKEAIVTHSSDKMAEGLKETGWATSSVYEDSLKTALKTYNLYRFDDMTLADLKNGVYSKDTIVQAAFTQLGVPYVWGGTTPNVALDCSGLTQYCYAQAGIAIPRNSEDQHAAGTSIPLEEAEPGDVLWKPGHVAIYIGGDSFIHAPHAGDVVRQASGINYFTCAVTWRERTENE